MALTEGLVSYWKLDGNSTDSIGSNNGTDSNITYNASYGKIDQGANFNGSSSKITLGSGSIPTGANARSVSLWFKSDITTIETMFSYGNNIGAGTAFLLHANVGGTGQVYFGSSGSNDAYTANDVFTNGNWTHLVLTYSGGTISSSTLKIYVNGDSKSLTFTSPAALNTAASNYTIGYDTPYATRYFDGSIDEVGIWNRGLSATEISQLYAAGNGLTYPFLPTNLKFRPGSLGSLL